MALDLVVSGATGRMGRTLGRLIREAEDLRALGGIAPDPPAPAEAGDYYPRIVPVRDAGDMVRQSVAVVDFSAPDQLRELIERHGGALAGRALVVGTTGLDPSLERRLDALATTAAVLTAANFSPGLNLLLELVRQAAAALDADRYDVEIVEAHHRRKEDAPSGTALSLGRAVADARGAPLDPVRVDGRAGRPGARPRGEIGFHAVRGGEVVGEHTVQFLGDDEQVMLGHVAGSRDLFAAGALEAVRWIADRGSGRYTMGDVLGL